MTTLPWLSLLQLSGGLLLLITGAELLVRAAVRLAAGLGVRPLLLGLTVVAFGSSAPQLAVSVQAAVTENADIAVGSVIGGTIFNTLVTLGLSALIVPLRVSRQLLHLDIPLMILASLLVFGLALNEQLGRLDGALMLITFALYLGLRLRQSRRHDYATAQPPTTAHKPTSWLSSLTGMGLTRHQSRHHGHATAQPPTTAHKPTSWHSSLTGMGLTRHQSRHHGHATAQLPATKHRSAPWLSSLTWMGLGLALLVLAGRLLLDAAVTVASELGLSERIIGLTVVAVGTSLPQLATSLIAAIRGQRDIAVGNVIGGNLFNLLGVLGLTALLAPAPLSVSPNALTFDLPVMLGVALLCWPILYSGYRITRAEGLVLLGLYLAYGLHVIWFTTGMPMADSLERLMLFFILPALLAYLLFSTVSAWRRQHS